MRANIDRNTKLILEKYRKYDTSYDKRTQHGATRVPSFRIIWPSDNRL